MKNMKKVKLKTVYAFIDSQNLNLGVRSQGWQLDFKRFRIYLKDKYRAEKAFLFLGFIPKNKGLYEYLEKSGYTIIYKPVVESKLSKIKTKGNVDAELVLHTMIEFPNYDKAIIISGDGDFHCLIEYLEKRNKLGRLIIPNQKRYSRLFLKFKKHMDYMNNLKGKMSKK
jgi:uncharacterized LabA/DUF88 family protein